MYFCLLAMSMFCSRHIFFRESLLSLTEKIFETEGDLSIIAAVISVCKTRFVKPNGFPLRMKIANIVKFNKKCDKAEFLRKALNFKQKTQPKM
jgi:hypothetical protein